MPAAHVLPLQMLQIEDHPMTALTDKDARTDILNRLRRAFAERRGYAPRVLALPEGLLACGPTEAAADRAADFAAAPNVTPSFRRPIGVIPNRSSRAVIRPSREATSLAAG